MADAPAAKTPQNSLEADRRAKLQKLRDLGVDPYGHRLDGTRPLAELKAVYQEEHGHDGGPIVRGAGRIVLKRDMGKLSFLTLRDASGDLQIALDKRRLDDQAWQIRGLLDLGDHLAVEGPIGTTNKGEVTIWATQIWFSGKALTPPPDKYHGLEDVELRYRQRYVDLWANPASMAMAQKRAEIVRLIREYWQKQGFVEVETPMMQTLHGGAAARPFETKSNALDLPLYMRIAPELYLKRLLVGGMPKIFELNRNFRNEGVSPRHNPEFTMLEAYEAFGSWETMAEHVEEMICQIAEKVCGGLKIEHKDAEGNVTRTIDLSQRPWRRATMAELVEEATGWKFDGTAISPDSSIYRKLAGRVLDDYPPHRSHDGVVSTDDDERRKRELATEIERFFWSSPGAGSPAVDVKTPAEQLVAVYEKLVEPNLFDPVFVTRVPSVIIPLAKPCADDPYFADVYELAINGQEISPGYTELNDPDVQAEQFRRQVGDEAERQAIDTDFLDALKVGMPPAGGMGLGVDRLVMLLTGAASIRDVVLFPLMKPKAEATERQRDKGTEGQRD
jgi:lysyl-tRNA synthetase class 2